MRIQIAELPTITLGDATEHPFILILDGVTPEQAEAMTPESIDTLRRDTNARAIIVTSDTIDVVAALTLDDDHRARLAAAVDRLL